MLTITTKQAYLSSPSPVPTRASSLYRRPVRAGAKGEVSSVRFERTLSGISGLSLYRWGTRTQSLSSVSS